MGKVTGFLEIDRHDRKYEPAGDRVRHFREFLIPMDNREVAQQGSRCMDCGIPYCHNGCPVNNIIPDWNDLAYKEQWRDALEMRRHLKKKTTLKKRRLSKKRGAPHDKKWFLD